MESTRVFSSVKIIIRLKLNEVLSSQLACMLRSISLLSNWIQTLNIDKTGLIAIKSAVKKLVSKIVSRHACWDCSFLAQQIQKRSKHDSSRFQHCWPFLIFLSFSLSAWMSVSQVAEALFLVPCILHSCLSLVLMLLIPSEKKLHSGLFSPTCTCNIVQKNIYIFARESLRGVSTPWSLGLAAQMQVAGHWTSDSSSSQCSLALTARVSISRNASSSARQSGDCSYMPGEAGANWADNVQWLVKAPMELSLLCVWSWLWSSQKAYILLAVWPERGF